jgi:hypothetical protein
VLLTGIGLRGTRSCLLRRAMVGQAQAVDWLVAATARRDNFKATIAKNSAASLRSLRPRAKVEFFGAADVGTNQFGAQNGGD